MAFTTCSSAAAIDRAACLHRDRRGAGLIMVSTVFTQVNIPLEAVALIAGIDRVLDMARTSLNVLGDATGALLVSKLEGDLHKDPFDDDEESKLDTGVEPYEKAAD